jgi:DNA-binding PadR family transcriptional regulator
MKNVTPKERAVLVVLSHQELYKVEIVERVEQATRGAIKLSFVGVLIILHQLETKGYIESRWGTERPNERGGRRRRYYRTTELGREFVVTNIVVNSEKFVIPLEYRFSLLLMRRKFKSLIQFLKVLVFFNAVATCIFAVRWLLSYLR